jgi:very-short-patch-repair endonuclease
MARSHFWHTSGSLWLKLKPRARTMRAAPTEAEAVLWESLRGRRLRGFKFRRQEPIGPYIVDFVCTDAALIVEVDGEIHADQVAEDLRRDRSLTELGFKVLRLSNDTILRDHVRALNEIAAAVRANGGPTPGPPRGR